MMWEPKGTVAGRIILLGAEGWTLCQGGWPALHRSMDGPAAGSGGQAGVWPG